MRQTETKPLGQNAIATHIHLCVEVGHRLLGPLTGLPATSTAATLGATATPIRTCQSMNGTRRNATYLGVGSATAAATGAGATRAANEAVGAGFEGSTTISIFMGRSV